MVFGLHGGKLEDLMQVNLSIKRGFTFSCMCTRSSLLFYRCERYFSSSKMRQAAIA
jgi:hypothetical protein